MEKYGFKNVKLKDPSQYQLTVVDHKITVAQIERGPSDMGKYRSALQSAEAIHRPNRRQLYNLIKNVKTDGILDAIVEKRIRAVTISPLSLEGTEDEVLIKLFKAPWMYDLLRGMMESKFWGHSLIEPKQNMAAFDDPELEQLFDLRMIPRENVSPEFGIISTNPFNFGSGLPFREDPYVNYLFEFGHERSLGLYINLIPYVLYKRNNWADFAQFNELFGMPLRTYEYDPHQPDTRKQVEEQAKAAGAAPYVIIPKGTNVSHQSASTSAGNVGYKDFNSIMNQEMTITTLGQTLTTGADGKGSYALGDIHKDVEESINLEDKVWCEYQLNWNVKKKLIQSFGIDKLRGCTFKFDDTIKLSPTEKANILTSLNQITPIDQQYIRDEFNLPVPDQESITIWTSKRAEPAAGQVQLSYPAAPKKSWP